MILGIDPGIRKLGYALIENNLSIVDAGIIRFDEKNITREDQYKRMYEISGFFEKIIEKYPVKKINIEKYFFTQFNKSNAEFVYGARGIILMIAVKNNIEIGEYTPIELKKRITGNAKASKEVMQKVVSKLYGLKDIPEYHDAADALGLAYFGTRKGVL